MKRVLATARKVADSHATVLLTGESGTGKGVLARAIHAWSPRSEGSFGVVSCPSLRSALLQSELFGHVRRAFTGAVSWCTTGTDVFRRRDSPFEPVATAPASPSRFGSTWRCIGR